MTDEPGDSDTDALLSARLREAWLSIEVDDGRASNGPLIASGSALIAFGAALIALSAEDSIPLTPLIGGTFCVIVGFLLLTYGALSTGRTTSRSADLLRVRAERIRLERAEEVRTLDPGEVVPPALEGGFDAIASDDPPPTPSDPDDTTSGWT